MAGAPETMASDVLIDSGIKLSRFWGWDECSAVAEERVRDTTAPYLRFDLVNCEDACGI